MIGFGVDNTSVNLGVHESIMTHVKAKNDSCYFMGCPCHIVHNIASKGSKAFTKISGFDVEDLCVDAFIGSIKVRSVKECYRNSAHSVIWSIVR